MPEINMNEPDLREIASALRYLEGREDECSSNRRMWGQIADSIEEQVKPVIEEPQAFGSIVRARSRSKLTMLWHPSPMHGKHYWESETGAVEVWSELTDVEVLRVGLGESDGDERRLEIRDAEDKAFADGYNQGCKEMYTSIHIKLVGDVLPLAIANERQIGVEKAIQAVEELAP